MPMTPPPFAMVLRKFLKNARMTAVRQLGFDRVLALDFDTKFGQMHLYVEVFREGNVILVDQDGIIIQPLTHAKYSGRILKKGVEYQPPPAALDPHDLDETALKDMFENSDRDLVATLGGKANLGGTHALTTGAKGYLILKPDKEQSSANLQVLSDEQTDDAKRDKFLEQYANEASPTLLPAHDGKPRMEFATLCAAVDAWRGPHDAGALARREAEKLDIASPGRGFSTEVEKLERRKAQQEKALSGFTKKIELSKDKFIIK